MTTGDRLFFGLVLVLGIVMGGIELWAVVNGYAPWWILLR